MDKKTTALITSTSILTTALGILGAINKTINKLATSKELLSTKNKNVYHWRFGDISYSVTGNGYPILLIHDLKEDSSSVEWCKIVPELSKTNTVYAIDLLGCGLSERPDITYTSYMYTQLVNDFIRTIIKKPTNVVCTGKSCSFVLEACAGNEDAFEDIILINPEGIRNLHKSPSKRTKTAKFIIKTPIIGTFIYQLITAKNMIEEAFEEEYFYDPEKASEALIDCYFESAHLGGKSSKNLYASLVGRYTNANIIRTLKNIDNNIHILAGQEIKGIETIMKEYAYYNPAIEIEYLEYAKKLPQLENPDDVLSYIQLYFYQR